MKVRIGTIVATGKPFLVDDQKLLETRALIVGNSGAGKSYVVRKCAETLHKRIQNIIIDWKGEYLTLREKFDFVLCGGDKAEVKIEYHSARLRPKMPDVERVAEEKLEAVSRERTIEMAHLLLKLRKSVVIDLSAIAHKVDRLAFAGVFLEAIGAEAPKRLWHPVLVWVDEVHLLAPEKGDTSAKQPTIDIMALTRQRGAGGNAATQRLSKYDKDGEAEANNVMVGRTALDSDLDRSGRLIGFSSKRFMELKHLSPGQFFCFGPAFNVDEVTLVQIDPVATTHPRPGRVRARYRLRKPTAQIRRALKGLTRIASAKTAAVTKEAQEFEAMKVKIAELKKELLMARGKIVARTEIREVEVKVKVPVLTRAHEKLLGRVDAALKKIHAVVSSLQDEAEEVGKKVGEVSGIVASIATNASTARVSTSPKMKALPPAKILKNAKTVKGAVVKSDVVPSGHLEGRHFKVLIAIAGYLAEGLTTAQLALASDYAPSTRGFLDIMRALRSEGLITWANGRAEVTDTGLKEANAHGADVHPPCEYAVEDHIDYWSGLMEGRFQKVLAVIVDGKTTTAEVAEASGYAPSTRGFLDVMRFLRSVDLIEWANGKAEPTAFLTRGN